MAKGVILFFALIVLSIAQASAGLILNNTQIYVNKSVGVNVTTPIQLTNNESFPFYNISFESNPYITIGQIPTLPAGSTLFMNATAFTDIPVSTTLRIKGFYTMLVGQNPTTRQVNISSYTSVQTPCDLSIIKGDSVQWTVSSSLMQNIELRQEPYGQGINTIANLVGNQSYTKQFTAPATFKYRFYVGGFSPGECTITVLDDNGAVNNPIYDAIANVNINTTYQPTTMTMNVLTSNYTMDFFGTQDGLMSVSNTGSLTAHSVQLSGDWFSFSANGFDLAPGETKGIVFTIQPIVLQTSDTNTSYQKAIAVSGNFQTISSNISVFIRYADIFGNSSAQSDFDYFNRTFCPSHPHSIFCDPEQKVVYKYIDNGSNQEINFSMTQAQFKELWLYIFQQGDDLKTLSNFIKEHDQQKTEAITNLSSDSAYQRQLADQNAQNTQQTVNGLVTFGIIILLCVAGGITGVLIFIYRQKTRTEYLRRMGAVK